MDYLTDEELKRAKICTSNIYDKLQSVMSELSTATDKHHAYKSYLKEKMDSITWDVNVLNHIINKEEENEES